MRSKSRPRVHSEDEIVMECKQYFDAAKALLQTDYKYFGLFLSIPVQVYASRNQQLRPRKKPAPRQ